MSFTGKLRRWWECFMGKEWYAQGLPAFTAGKYVEKLFRERYQLTKLLGTLPEWLKSRVHFSNRRSLARY
jgi:hypothetical protein